jgi:hypothetical protein
MIGRVSAKGGLVSSVLRRILLREPVLPSAALMSIIHGVGYPVTPNRVPMIPPDRYDAPFHELDQFLMVGIFDYGRQEGEPVAEHGLERPIINV